MREVIKGVRIHDNGIRSFVPPCFCWDVVQQNGEKNITVSDVVLSESLLATAKSVEEALKGVLEARTTVDGFTESYEIPKSSQDGVRFVITKLASM